MNETRDNNESWGAPESRSPHSPWRSVLFGAVTGSCGFLLLALLFLGSGLLIGSITIVSPRTWDHIYYLSLSGAFLGGIFGGIVGMMWGLERQFDRTGRAARERMFARAFKAGPFAAAPRRPFESRLNDFAGKKDDGSEHDSPESTMPFYLATTPDGSFRPKSAAFVRRILDRIHQALRGTARQSNP